MNGPQNLSEWSPKHIDELSCANLMSIYTTAIRSLYRHVEYKGPISCKFNGIGNKLGEW